MSDWPYSDQELEQYFEDTQSRRSDAANNQDKKPGREFPPWMRKLMGEDLDDPRKRQAFRLLSGIFVGGFICFLILAVYFASFAGELPNFEQLDNPSLQLATVAYTADGVELQRYALQNRSWVEYEDISPSVINALVSTEDHRFHQHSGIDVVRTLAIPYHVLRRDPQGGSTITQQLARNLYNDQIGRERTVKRKLKEMITAVQLERRYTKREVIEMYLNTVEFANNAYGIDAAARTFFSKTPSQLDTLEAATLVGLLKALTYYNPIRNPENSQRRRNVVLSQMVKRGVLDNSYYQASKELPVVTNYRSSDITSGLAPYFAEHVRNVGVEWANQNGYDFYVDGLVIYTTLDSKLQLEAEKAVAKRSEELQKVVDFEWSRAGGYAIGSTTEPYVERTGYEPFAHYWKANREYLLSFIRESSHFRQMRRSGLSDRVILDSLEQNVAFMDSLRSEKTRLEAGLVSVDPRTGDVKAWVGGRDLSTDWFDHVSLAKRQPGSTFKPFVYTAAIDNGYSPYHMLRDTTFLWTDGLGNEWSPTNSGDDPGTGELVTLREGLVKSKNTITGQLVL
ncbi:MAG: transglycosylase domain-containing protein, partial [Gammaproteobacteria bacterium]|nr:transglycosylase domain-containing protein [Gammaproteobacteria bacterium]